MIRIYLMVYIFLAIYGEAEGQRLEFPPDEFIEWNEFYRLSWEDFKGQPQEGSAGDAGTSVFIKAQPYREGKKLYYTVRAFFNKKKSWVKDTSDALLGHEQLHFDIAELYARKARRKIKEFGELKVEEIKVYNSAINEILKESNDVDFLYDVETLHGSFVKRQKEWRKKVEEELKALSDYEKEKWIIE